MRIASGLSFALAFLFVVPMEARAEPDDACTTTCADVERDYYGDPSDEGALRWSACFSCRCKSALGRLPRPEELKCSTAAGPLARWKAAVADGVVTGLALIDPQGDEGDKVGCLNRGLAAAGCDLQSRFKRIVYEDGKLEFQLLCRKPTAASDGYYEYLIIGHNQANGATCFWQARDYAFDGEAVPEMDLTGAGDTPANRAAYAATFHTLTAGPSTCTACHANDAFLWSPYFHSVWPMSAVRRDPAVRARIAADSKYFQVAADKAELQPIITDDLTAPGQPLEADCGGCHRVTRGSYCAMARRALGGNGHGLDPASALQHGRELLYWMRPGNHPLTYYDATRAKVAAACGSGF